MPTFADRRAQFNRRFVNRVVTPLSGRLPMWSRVEHVGRRSGTVYRTPVSGFSTPDGVAIMLPYGRARDWVRNLQSAGGGRVTMGGRTFAVSNPRIVLTAEAAALMDQPWRTLAGRTGVEWTLLLTRAS